MRPIYFAILLVICGFVNAKESKSICEISSELERYLEMQDLYSFSDADFSPKSVAAAQRRISSKKSSIPDNDSNIVKGGELQAALMEAKKQFDLIKKDKAKESYDYELRYLETHIMYCDFIRKTRLIDW